MIRLQKDLQPFDPYRWLATSMTSLLGYDVDPIKRYIVHASAGHTVEAVHMPRIDQVLPGQLFRPRQPTGTGVVFGHGIGVQRPTPYFRLIGELLERGVTVLSFEIDGHGENPTELGCPSCLGCAPTALDYLRQLEGIDPDRIGYMGMSLGGALGVHAAATVPWIKAMVLIATPIDVEISESRKFFEALGTLHPRNAGTLLDASLEHMLSCFFQPVRFANRVAHSLLDPPFYEEAAELIRALDPLSEASRLPHVPTRLLHGEWDHVVPPESSYRLLEALPGPAELLTFPRTNHFTIVVHREVAIAAAEWFEAHL